uniref:Uncharacterized protein n=1 Tax=Arundo donax TaxID=35708 RepID=A0A0A8YLR7_ARUDO
MSALQALIHGSFLTWLNIWKLGQTHCKRVTCKQWPLVL